MSQNTNDPTKRPQRIIVLGGGFAGAYCVQALDRALPQADIILINRHNYFIFYPLLVEAGTGTLNPRTAVVSLRSFCRRATFLMGEIEDVEPQLNEVHYRPAGEGPLRTLVYDQLVIALGSVTSLPPVPGLKEYGYEIKSLAHAVELRDRAIRLLEQADQEPDAQRRKELLTIVVVGGSFTGVEVAGEFNAYLREAAKKYRNISLEDVRVVLVEHGQRLLKSLDDSLSDWAAVHLRRRGVELHLADSVDRIEADCCWLKQTGRIATCTVIWCAGVAAPPVLQKVEVPRDRLGYMRCRPDGRVEGYDNVWGIGDCAINPNGEGGTYPPTAQHAVQLGRQVAANIVRVVRGHEPVPIQIRSKGTLAAFGYHSAVAKVGKLKLTGFPAWFLWRTAYLIKMPTLRKKLRVAWDWTADLIFPHEFFELGVHRASGIAPHDPTAHHHAGRSSASHSVQSDHRQQSVGSA